MGFLDNLFGAGSKKKDALKAYGDANATLAAGKSAATSALNSGRDQQLGALKTGYDQSYSQIGQGYDAADDRITSGYGTARNELGAGYDAAGDAARTYGDRAVGYLDPYMQSGTKAQGILDNYYGANGAAAQGAIAQNFADSNNPLTAYRDELAMKAQRAAFNSAGQSASGRAQSAIARASLARKAQDFQDYLAQVNLGASRGLQAANSAGNFTMHTGDVLANLERDRGTGLAGLSTDEATKRANLATGRGTTLGNLTYGYGQDQAGAYGSNARDIANLEYGNAQQLAGNRINLGNAYAATRGIGMNNLVQLAGTAAKAYFGGGFIPNRLGGGGGGAP